jgi:heme exporter protein B
MLAVIWKDLLLEFRNKETVTQVVVLGVLMQLVFNFSLVISPHNALDLAPGILWASIVFAGMLALSRTFIMERENGCLTGLMMAPMDRGTLFFAKFIVNLCMMATFEAFLLPAFGLFFGVGPVVLAALPHLIAVLVAGSVGITAVGTLFALAALKTTSRELMLSVLVLPIQLPLLIAAVQCTRAVLDGQSVWDTGQAGVILVVFDILFLTVGWLTFEYVALDS